MAIEYKGAVEYAAHRKIRERNTKMYRLCHWPLWIWVFFLAPGPLTFSLFAHGFSRGNALWLGVVMLGTGIAVLFGQAPGAEPAPYILRFDEDRPNPMYRRVCYTFAWNAVLNFALLNLAGLVVAVVTGHWYLAQFYRYGYFVILGVVVLLGTAGLLPRVGQSTKGEGTERRYFYGSVWAATIGQTVLLIFWKSLPNEYWASVVKLGVYVATLVFVGMLAWRGKLPRTRPIVAGELMVD